MWIGIRLGVVTGLLALAGPVHAQEDWKVSRDPATADVATLDGIIAAFYDVVSGPAGQPRDWTRDSTLYLPGVRFTTAGRGRDGSYRASIVSHGQYATSFGPGLANGFFEKEIHRVTQRFGPMVQVFSTYEWRTQQAGPVGGRGINAIELFHDGQRWWIASAMWFGEDADNPIPAEYVGKRDLETETGSRLTRTGMNE